MYICTYLIMKTRCPPGYHHNQWLYGKQLMHSGIWCTVLVPIAGTNEPKSAQQVKQGA